MTKANKELGNIEEVLKESEQYYRSLFNSMTEMFQVLELIYDANGKPIDYYYRDVNPAFERLVGKTREQLIDKRVKDIFGIVEDYWLEAYDKVLKTGKPVDFENYGAELDKYYEVHIWKIKENQVAVIFNETTQRKKAEEALKESEGRYRRIVENTTEGIWEMDENYITSHVNHAMASMLGYKIEEMIGKPVTDFMLKEDLNKHRKRMRKREQGEYGKYETRFKHKNGKTVWTSVSANPKIDDKGGFKGSFAIFINITERKKAEEELIKSEANYHSLFDNIDEAFQLFEAVYNEKGDVCDFQFLDVNPAYKKYAGIEPEAVIGKTIGEIYPETEQYWLNSFSKVLRTGKSINFEQFMPPLNKYYYVHAFRYADNKLAMLFKDITEQKKLEEQLKKSHDNLELKVQERTREIKYQSDLLENVNDAIIATDKDFIITSWNKAAEKIYGWKAEEVVGKDSTLILQIEFPDSDKEEMIKSIVKKGSFKGESTHRRKDGTKIPIETTLKEIKESKNKIIGYVAVNRDISKRKKTQIELQKLINELERSNKELQQFAYVASHDLQEPLRTIASFTQLLERRYKDKLDSDADEFMDYIVEAAKRMQHLINDLLDYSRVTTKGREFESVNVNEILDNVLQNLKSLINENNANITCDSLPTVMGDKSQLNQVFQNLIGNAIKFKKQDEPPKIHISASKDKKKNEYVFSVSDNGIGMEEQYAERIFVLFQRLHTRDVYDGTGIGLTISKKIIERHGGRIWVESELGEGSTFYFTIPFKD